jgi:addiction module RelB/DinJ family antitoxin
MERVNFRIERQVRQEAEAVFRALGLNLSSGLNLYLRRVAAEHAIPFPLALTREELLGPESAARERDMEQAVQNAIVQTQSEGRPIARFDFERGLAFLEHADGRREYADN